MESIHPLHDTTQIVTTLLSFTVSSLKTSLDVNMLTTKPHTYCNVAVSVGLKGKAMEPADM